MTTDLGKILNTKVPERQTTPGEGGGTGVEVVPAELKKMVGAAKEMEADTRIATQRMVPESEEAVSGLGPEWTTSARIRALTGGWETALNELAGQLGEIGPKLARTADNHILAEAVSRQAVQSIGKALGG